MSHFDGDELFGGRCFEERDDAGRIEAMGDGCVSEDDLEICNVCCGEMGCCRRGSFPKPYLSVSGGGALTPAGRWQLVVDLQWAKWVSWVAQVQG